MSDEKKLAYSAKKVLEKGSELGYALFRTVSQASKDIDKLKLSAKLTKMTKVDKGERLAESVFMDLGGGFLFCKVTYQILSGVSQFIHHNNFRNFDGQEPVWAGFFCEFSKKYKELSCDPKKHSGYCEKQDFDKELIETEDWCKTQI